MPGRLDPRRLLWDLAFMSLFICPCCNFQDSPIWKSSHWRRYSVYCNVSELETFFPVLFEKLKASVDGWVYEKPYWYQINKSKTIVNRMTQMGKDEFSSHGFTEKRRPAQLES